MLHCDKNEEFLIMREVAVELIEDFWCPLTESNCQSMITSQVLYHLTKGACGVTRELLLPLLLLRTTNFFAAKPNILTYFTSFRLGLPLEIGVFFSAVGSGGLVFSIGKDIP